MRLASWQRRYRSCRRDRAVGWQDARRRRLAELSRTPLERDVASGRRDGSNRLADVVLHIRNARRHNTRARPKAVGRGRSYRSLGEVAAGLMAHSPRLVRMRHRQLGTSHGRRDHTVLPYASAPDVLRAASAHEAQLTLRTLLAPDAVASTASHPASVAIAKRPSLGWGAADFGFDLPTG